MNGKNDRAKLIASAEKLAKTGKLADAIAAYESLFDGTDRDVPLRTIIGDLFLRAGRPDGAVKALSENAALLERQGSTAQALALWKRIQKFAPDDSSVQVKIGDLYSGLGFSSEARAEYAKALQTLSATEDIPGQIALFEKAIRLDRTDVESRIKLARLLIKSGHIDRAVNEINDTAEILLSRKRRDEAFRLLLEARKIKDGDARTLSALAGILAREKRIDEAVAMVEESLSKHGSQPEILALLGDLCLEGRKDARAREIFSRMLEEDPHHVEARAKLGILEIRAGRPDEAFALYEPPIAFFIGRAMEDKAAGLLGLILLAHPAHLPSLKKLAALFRRAGKPEALETVLRVLLQETVRAGREDLRLETLRELAELCPEDKAVVKEMRKTDRVAGARPKESAPPPIKSPPPGQDQEIIRTNLIKADLYVEQDLIRNARRILENLRLLYPEDPRIQEKIDRLPPEPPPVAPEQIAALLERWKTSGEIGGGEGPASFLPEVSLDEAGAAGTVSISEIFSGLSEAPESRPPATRFSYPDLTDKLREELDSLEAAFFRQVKERTAVVEKDLAEIVSDFKRQVESRIEPTNTEARYALGLAFLEQGLLDEAVAELEWATRDPSRAADAYGLIARAFRRKRNHREALRRTDEALKYAAPRSDAEYALIYERAEILEDLNENGPALEHFERVKAWNAGYRDVAKRVKILKKII